MELNTSDALLAQNKLLAQQIEALTKQMSMLPQQLHAVQAPPVQYSPQLKCDFCGGEHPNGFCDEQATHQEEVNYMGNQQRGGNFNSRNFPSNNNFMQGNQGWRNNNGANQPYGWRNDAGPSNRNPQQQQQNLTPNVSLTDRVSKLEDTLTQFMQATQASQKNIEASVRNLEVQMGQFAKQLANSPGGSFSANTQTNPKERCNSITTRSGKVVGSDVEIQGEKVEREKEEKENEGEKDELRENMKNKRESEKEKEYKKGELEKEKESGVDKKNKEKGKEVISTNPIKKIPYPHAPSKNDKERQFARFMDIIKRLQINIPFTEAMEQMPTYARFMKDLLTKKRRFLEEETVELEAGCSAIIQKSLPQKSRDPGSFTLLVTIGELFVGKALLDLGASINLMPLSMLKRIGDVEVRPTRMTLQLADRSLKYPHGIVEDILVKVDKFLFPVDFVVMDMEEDTKVPLILGRPFMKTARVIIDMDDGKFKVRVQDEEVVFNVFEAMKFPKGSKDCFRVDVMDEIYLEAQRSLSPTSPMEKALIHVEDKDEEVEDEVQKCIEELNKGWKHSCTSLVIEELKKRRYLNLQS
ncbi:hypothetical protein Fmac_017518 [Flemingia macrophylla]|uniref:Uncharacterized protein n=1 Tax=Flemingia macrophylla TaxID=520843 RepID=A0ABD1M2C4_9FABA